MPSDPRPYDAREHATRPDLVVVFADAPDPAADNGDWSVEIDL